MNEPDRDAPPPATASDVRRRSGRPATAEFPPVSLELFRTWSLPFDFAVTTRVRNGSVVVEAAAQYGGRVSEPPHGAAETPDPTRIQVRDDAGGEATAGYYPEHLPLAPVLETGALPVELRPWVAHRL